MSTHFRKEFARMDDVTVKFYFDLALIFLLFRFSLRILFFLHLALISYKSLL